LIRENLMSAKSLKQTAIARTRELLSVQRVATAIAAASVLSLSTAARAATIKVNSLADPGAAGICALRDAITAVNTKTAANGCAAGTGNDHIRFSVSGTIMLADTLPEVTDGNLTIKGPITINGNNADLGMQVASGARLNLKNVTIANGGNPFAFSGFSGILNKGTLTVINSTFSNNSGGFNQFGLGCISNQGKAIVANSTFSGNGDGGAIVNIGTLTVTNSTFSDNLGHGDAGITNRGTATITNSTFSGNSAGIDAGEGAGAIGNQGTMTITNSTFFGNGAAEHGGAIDNYSGDLTIINSTFLGNIAGGGFGSSSISGSASLHGTILADGIGGNCDSTQIDVGYNISDDDSCGFSAVGSQNNTDPKLSSVGLTDNGGPTETIALLSGSPAIDAIPVDSCVDQMDMPLRHDQRGFPRPDPGEALCDIGAYEFQESFVGQPGRPNCFGKSTLALSHQYGSLRKAASALNFRSTKALKKAIQKYCGNSAASEL
jgi:hypothetical protein